jgi:hypothetical protein
MNLEKLSDAEAKDVLLRWPTRTSKLWPPPGGKGYWIQGQPKSGSCPGPRLSAPGAMLFRTQPDGLWVHFQGCTSCDVVAVEVCGTVQNLNDKRSRYIPASHSLVLSCAKYWLEEEVSVNKGGQYPRWKAAASFGKAPKSDISVPVRHLRVLYALPNKTYHAWGFEHIPTGYEFFCPHSSLDSFSSQKMQRFLRQMSIEAQFYVRPKQS